jgi:hypothetical protein
MVVIDFHTARAATAGAGGSPNGVIPNLSRDNLLLEAGQQPLRFGQGQTQVGDIGEITEPLDLHNIRGRSLAFSTDLHRPHNPCHASTPGQRTNAKIPPLALTPQNWRQSRALRQNVKTLQQLRYATKAEVIRIIGPLCADDPRRLPEPSPEWIQAELAAGRSVIIGGLPPRPRPLRHAESLINEEADEDNEQFDPTLVDPATAAPRYLGSDQ